MRASDFDYELPVDRIAQHAVEPRDAARLLVHDVARDATEHRLVRDLPDLLRAGDLLVVNDTRVKPARLCGRRATGGWVEVLVLGPALGTPGRLWRALVKPAGRLKIGEKFALENGALFAIAVQRSTAPDGHPGSEWTLELGDEEGSDRTLDELLERNGRMPLPPYIRRGRGEDPHREIDRQRYQTVFACHTGAVAAPTAGLHFTPELIARLASGGIETTAITLHVGAGSFQPVTAEDIAQHVMHSEGFVLPASTVEAVERTRARGGRVIAVGTTSVRVLESCSDELGALKPTRGETNVFITPGHRFHVVDALLTNFHLPRSTLLMLVSAFAGRERVLRLYREAVSAGYRFYSYGDAMLLT